MRFRVARQIGDLELKRTHLEKFQKSRKSRQQALQSMFLEAKPGAELPPPEFSPRLCQFFALY